MPHKRHIPQDISDRIERMHKTLIGTDTPHSRDYLESQLKRQLTRLRIGNYHIPAAYKEYVAF